MSWNPGREVQKFSNLKDRGLLGPLSSASKRGQWSERDDDKACNTWVLKVVSHSALQKKESSLQRVGFVLSLLQVKRLFCRWISLSSQDCKAARKRLILLRLTFRLFLSLAR